MNPEALHGVYLGVQQSCMFSNNHNSTLNLITYLWLQNKA